MSKKVTKTGHSISKLVQSIVSSNFSYEQALFLGYANYSALARIIVKRLKSKGIKASEQAVISALKRYRRELVADRSVPYRVLSKSTVTVITDVIKLVFKNERSDEIIERTLKISDKVVHISKTSNALTVVAYGISKGDALKHFSKFKPQLLEVKDKLTLIIIHSPQEILYTPGCVELIYRFVSSAGINIEDTSSTYTDTLIVVKDEDASKAFDEISFLINYSKEQEKES